MQDERQSNQGPDTRRGAGEAEGASEALTETAAGEEAASAFDQTASDADQTASDRDSVQAEADQRASDRDQAVADREHASSAADDADEVFEASRADRLKSTFERVLTSRMRALTAAERLERTLRRDETAHLRDLSADERDRAAEQRDSDAANLERGHGVSGQSERDDAAAIRARAGADRARAAADRKQAAEDRAAAGRDRDQAREELEHAELDPLTGAFGRGLGMIALEHEISRARHGDGRLVLAFVDIDELKRINDSQGHAAGDAVIRDVVTAIHTHVRSYDPVVRVGGDEFVCALADCTPEEAAQRFQSIVATIQLTQPDASISVGLAALRPEDTLEQLVARGDRALYEVKLNTERPRPDHGTT
jgi:diguanylate cyclase (GGDEF)-like protein